MTQVAEQRSVEASSPLTTHWYDCN